MSPYESLTRLKTAVRTRIPDGLRRLYRASRAIASAAPLSAEVPEELLENCSVLASRAAMLHRLPHGGTVAELGTYEGAFADAILKVCRPSALHLIDIDFSRLAPKVATAPSVSLHRGITWNVMSRFEDEFFDWVYIDAGHDYASVSADARACAAKVKPGGFMIFNDFAHIDPRLGRYGVHRAVVDFCRSDRWSMTYLALHPAALYDVALRKPQ